MIVIGLEKLSEGDEGEQVWIVYMDAEKLARLNPIHVTVRQVTSPDVCRSI